MEIIKICDHCNKDFVLQNITHFKRFKISAINKETCPHCGKMNYMWMQIRWTSLHNLENELSI